MNWMLHRLPWLVVVLIWGPTVPHADEPPSWSGIYPHLAYYNQENECGTGAVVPWADRLWLVTYAPHAPGGSTDKLYSIDDDLQLTIHEESVGGTPANRMIHAESNQLFIGPYAIDSTGAVRVIPFDDLYGRPTGNARHLSDPENRIYYATMEEGFYEVDVHTLAVTELYPDGNRVGDVAGALLPGYHGKGLYSGQGRLVYANNGEHSQLARDRPDVASGCLAEWDGATWTVVRRNQFTEVTGPGGLRGNEHPETDPIWSIGWDHRSLILMVRDDGNWHSYRLPKASHCYDGAHGWNTEWPRIRDIGEDDLLMTMHGMFWRFPRSFTAEDSAGIAPRSTYLKVIGDFTRWNDRVVFGCDDTAKAEFLNKRMAQGDIAAPGQSQSNLWFVAPSQLEDFGPPIGRGAVWLDDSVEADAPSEPFLFAGFERRAVHLVNGGDAPVNLTFEIDPDGTGTWRELLTRAVPPGYVWQAFDPCSPGSWIRVRADRAVDRLTAQFTYAAADPRTGKAAAIFDGLAAPESPASVGGLLWARGDNTGTLRIALDDGSLFEMDGAVQLEVVEDKDSYAWMREHLAVPANVLTIDDASALYIDDDGKRYRLPKGDPALEEPGPLGSERIDREVCTERDLFNCLGTFYELPAQNAGGFAKIRPIATHNRRIRDYCSWRGLLVMSGIDRDEAKGNRHVVRSDDGRCAVWVGAVDDLWQFGKPTGHGGPWKHTQVTAGTPSDPYLFFGYDRKRMALENEGDAAVTFHIEIDITGTGSWQRFMLVEVPAKTRTPWHTFPDSLQAYWIRAVASRDTTASVEFIYE